MFAIWYWAEVQLLNVARGWEELSEYPVVSISFHGNVVPIGALKLSSSEYLAPKIINAQHLDGEFYGVLAGRKCAIIGWVCDRCDHQVLVPYALDFVEFWDCGL